MTFLVGMFLFFETEVVASNLNYQKSNSNLKSNYIFVDGDSLFSGNMKGLFMFAGQLGGPEIIGIYGNIRIAKPISLNFGLSPILSAHIGLNIYPINININNNKNISVYSGIQVVTISHINFKLFGNSTLGDRYGAIYFPLGLEVIYGSGLTFQIEAGYLLSKKEININHDESQFNFALRVGKTFDATK